MRLFASLSAGVEKRSERVSLRARFDAGDLVAGFVSGLALIVALSDDRKPRASVYPIKLAHQLVVLGVRANPKPEQVIAHFNCQRSVLQSNTNGAILCNFLEMQRRV